MNFIIGGIMLIAGENMNLKEYLFLHRISVSEFSHKIKCNRSYFSRLINGHVKPGKRLAEDIEQATNGEVTAEELLKGKEE